MYNLYGGGVSKAVVAHVYRSTCPHCSPWRQPLWSTSNPCGFSSLVLGNCAVPAMRSWVTMTHTAPQASLSHHGTQIQEFAHAMLQEETCFGMFPIVVVPNCPLSQLWLQVGPYKLFSLGEDLCSCSLESCRPHNSTSSSGNSGGLPLADAKPHFSVITPTTARRDVGQ